MCYFLTGPIFDYFYINFYIICITYSITYSITYNITYSLLGADCAMEPFRGKCGQRAFSRKIVQGCKILNENWSLKAALALLGASLHRSLEVFVLKQALASSNLCARSTGICLWIFHRVSFLCASVTDESATHVVLVCVR